MRLTKFVRNLPIGVKVALAPMLAMACLLIVSAQSYVGNIHIGETLQHVSTRSLPEIAAVGGLKERITHLSSQVLLSMVYQGTGVKADVIGELDRKIAAEFAAMAPELDALKASRGDDADATARADRAIAAFKKFRQTSLDALDMKSEGLNSARQQMGASVRSYESLRKELGDIVAAAMDDGTVEAAAARTSIDRFNRATLGLLALCVVLSASATVWCSTMIVRPLGRAVALAREVARGDLRQRALIDSSDATGQVLVALDEVGMQLNGIVSNIRASAEEIETASKEIASGNSDLSVRTERTASSLQQAASTIEQLTKAVKTNADTALRADKLGVEAASVARQGGEAVGEVMSSMASITSHSKRIADIIGTIDGLAFQTNILALNAAVEAARAGEQGRGFAVVAGEVRSLAQRSATAAKEIRGLIGASVDQVATGSQKVQAAGATMQEIVGSIERVNALMGEISQAVIEQAAALDTVNGVIRDMDQSTQQNSALVEQASAAAESLRTQAGGLVQAVAVFQVT